MDYLISENSYIFKPYPNNVTTVSPSKAPKRTNISITPIFNTTNLFDCSANPRDSTAKVDMVVKQPKKPVAINKINQLGNNNSFERIVNAPNRKLPRTLTVKVP